MPPVFSPGFGLAKIAAPAQQLGRKAAGKTVACDKKLRVLLWFLGNTWGKILGCFFLGGAYFKVDVSDLVKNEDFDNFLA